MSEPAKINVVRFIEPDQLKRDLAFSTNDLNTPFMQQASLATHYGILAAKASRQFHDLELALDVAEARIYRKLRDEAATAGEKTTEAALAKAVSVDPRIVAIKKAINEARQVEAQAKTAVDAFKQRRDMLVQAGLLSREEMKGEVSINARNEREADRENERKALAQRVASKAGLTPAA